MHGSPANVTVCRDRQL